MKSYHPNKIFGHIPRSTELIVSLILFNLIVFILLYIDFFKLMDYRKQYASFNSFIPYLILSAGFIVLKFYRTKTIVNGFAFDSEKQLLTIEYSLFYFFPKTVTIKYDDVSFEYYDGSGFEHPYIVVNIFDKNSKVVKFVSRNGWNKKKFNEILIELHNIKPTDKSPNKYF